MDLSSRREWVTLVRLGQKLHQEAANQLISFRDANDAYEKRGYAQGVRNFLDAIQTLYDSTRTPNDIRPEQSQSADDLDRKYYG